MKKLSVIVDNLRSAENVGSIIRTAEAFGFEKVYLCGITPPITHPKVKKSSLSAENYLKIENHSQTWRVIEKLKKEKWYIIALEQEFQAKNLFTTEIKEDKIAIIVGNEVRGISKKILARSDLILEIPLLGLKESLNVAVAFGICASQIVFQN